MRKNIIILTTGASGSSVLTGLISTQGYWLGEETKKIDFETYENAELVDLNIRILYASGFKRSDCNDLPPPSIAAIEKLSQSINLRPFLDFLERCKNHQPWVWKDPRLSFTIHFWAQLTDLSACRFIFIDRDPYQSYAGLILSRRVPMSFKDQIQINRNYTKSCNQFFKDRGLRPFKCTFEDLILDPENLLQKLNSFLELQIDLDHLKSIYDGRLFMKRYSKLDFIEAKLIYLFFRYARQDYIRFPRGQQSGDESK
ncbi:MAG: hypothetical protein ACFFCW_06845 [Candidatus Hodarchaeota archaeon]